MAMSSLSSEEAILNLRRESLQKQIRTSAPIDNAMMCTENKFEQFGNRPGDNSLKHT